MRLGIRATEGYIEDYNVACSGARRRRRQHTRSVGALGTLRRRGQLPPPWTGLKFIRHTDGPALLHHKLTLRGESKRSGLLL
jgi:hypothetical protein